MSVSISKTGERIIPEDFLQTKEAYLLYLRHLFAYETVKEFVSEKSSVIEIGCGEGYGTSYLSYYVKQIVGVDIHESVIRYASDKYNSEKCFFEVYDGSKIPYENNMFDAVISFQVIEHVHDDTNYLAEIHRIVKTDGICILTTPNGTYRVKPNKKPWNRFHIREYCPQELKGLLKSIFSEVHVWGICGNKEIQNIEKARINQAQQFAALDPLNLRRLIPASWEVWIVTWLKRILHRPRVIQANNDFLKAYSIDDYYITKSNVEESLDLLAICQP